MDSTYQLSRKNLFTEQLQVMKAANVAYMEQWKSEDIAEKKPKPNILTIKMLHL